MKHIIRNILIAIGSIYVLSLANGGFTYSGDYKTLLLAGFVMFFLDTIVEPILNIIFIPINFLTAGVFKWIIAVGLFYALVYFVPAVHINSWPFPGYTLQIPNIYTIRLPAYHFAFWPNLVLLSFMYNFIAGTFKWLCSD
ncbi:MAG: phage holin family protein [bacterium]|nr:phage holin family protein [bacterium]